MSNLDLANRTLLITGASSGLGAQFARAAAARGARVVLGARRTDRTEALAAELRATGAQALAVTLDVQDEASTIAAYDAAEAVFGPVDSVIANAGVTLNGTALDLDIKDFDQVFDINVRGALLTAREGARRMIAAGSAERRHGRILFISSITAFAPSPGLVAYAASKAAVARLGTLLAREFVRKGVNVNTISPGYIRTELAGDFFDSAAGQAQISKFPRQRMMDITDLDEAVLFLVSDASRAVTGAELTIDDGQTL